MEWRLRLAAPRLRGKSCGFARSVPQPGRAKLIIGAVQDAPVGPDRRVRTKPSIFVSWTPIQTNLVTTGAWFAVSDPQTGSFPHRFYRARIFSGTLPSPAIRLAGYYPGLATNGFGFNLAGVAGQTLIVESSTNLSVWSALATNLLNSGQVYFADPSATNAPWRFYRLRRQ